MSGYVVVYVICLFFFFFKQKTAYELRISDWSSYVCSSDLAIAKVECLVDRGTLRLGIAYAALQRQLIADVIFDIAENRIVLQALPVVVAGLIIILPDNLCIDIAGCRIGVVDFIVLAHTAVFVIGTDHPSDRRACVVGQTQFLIERLDRTIVAIDVQDLEIGAVALLQRLAAVRGRLSLCADQAAAAKWWLSMPMASVTAEGPMPKDRKSTRRNEERRVGNECVRTGRSRWAP